MNLMDSRRYRVPVCGWRLCAAAESQRSMVVTHFNALDACSGAGVSLLTNHFSLLVKLASQFRISSTSF